MIDKNRFDQPQPGPSKYKHSNNYCNEYDSVKKQPDDREEISIFTQHQKSKEPLLILSAPAMTKITNNKRRERTEWLIMPGWFDTPL